MKSTKQMSDSIRLGAILAVSGGFMDAYSYIQRDEVFANAQTGNMLLFGVKLSEGNFAGALQYFFPVLAFVLGIAAAELVHMRRQRILHWRQISVINEAVILAAVAFIPLTQNILANSLISFACGIQVESFRKIRGNGIATTMCIGNIRSGTQHLCQFIHSKDIKKLLPFVESGFVRGFGGDKLAGHDPYRHLEKTKRRMGECFEKLCKKHC